MQALEEFAATLRLRSGRKRVQWENLRQTIRELLVGDRPNRLEPRLKKPPPEKRQAHAKPRQSIALGFSWRLKLKLVPFGELAKFGA